MVQQSRYLRAIAALSPWRGEGQPGFYVDALGVRTRITYLPPDYQMFSGHTDSQPNDERAGISADPLEMGGVLQAVLDADSTFCCVELGAGWGPFVVASAVAARRRGITNVRLIAVEGAASHVEFMRQHFRDNGLDPSKHRLMQAVVGTYEGTARFPKLREPSLEWSGEAIYGAQGTAMRTPQRTTDDFEDVRCVTLAHVLSSEELVDVVHFDIQGMEYDVVTHGADILNTKVKRAVIGTHGRDIEQKLLTHFDAAGWTLEDDKACSFQQLEPHPITLRQDGVQVWRNRALLPVARFKPPDSPP